MSTTLMGSAVLGALLAVAGTVLITRAGGGGAGAT
jgi:hypothetical protein